MISIGAGDKGFPALIFLKFGLKNRPVAYKIYIRSCRKMSENEMTRRIVTADQKKKQLFDEFLEKCGIIILYGLLIHEPCKTVVTADTGLFGKD